MSTLHVLFYLFSCGFSMILGEPKYKWQAMNCRKNFRTTLFEFWNAKRFIRNWNHWTWGLGGNFRKCWKRRFIRSPMKDGAIFRNGRKRSARSRRHLRMNPVCGSSSSTAPHRFPAAIFADQLSQHQASGTSVEKPEKFDEIPSLRMTARFRIISSLRRGAQTAVAVDSGMHQAQRAAVCGIRDN